MNTLAKILVTTTLGFTALAAQAGQDNYPGDFPTPSSAGPRTPYIGKVDVPNIYSQGYAVESPKPQASSRSAAEVRAEIPRQRRFDIGSVNG